MSLKSINMNLPDANAARELANQVVGAPPNNAFDIILNSVARKITKAVKNQMHSTVFQVPMAVMGCPRYKIADVIQYIEVILTNKSYEVTSWPSGEMAIVNRNASSSSTTPVKNQNSILHCEEFTVSHYQSMTALSGETLNIFARAILQSLHDQRRTRIFERNVIEVGCISFGDHKVA
jgi:hypothetical protein